MDKIYKDIEEYFNNISKIFDGIIIIADMLNNKNLNPIVTESFIRIRKLSIYLAFVTQNYFAVPKNIRLNSTTILL